MKETKANSVQRKERTVRAQMNEIENGRVIEKKQWSQKFVFWKDQQLTKVKLDWPWIKESSNY